MVKLLATFILILAIMLFPPAALAYISQNSLPGDRLYPVKRGLEDGVLMIASISPVTKAFFAVSYSQRRYKETTGLLSNGSNEEISQSLNNLILQTALAANQIKLVSNPAQRRELIVNLSSQIQVYNQGLNSAKTQLTEKPSTSNTVSTTTTSTSNSNDSLAQQVDDTQKQLQTINDALNQANSDQSSPASGSDTNSFSLQDALNEVDNIDINSLQNAFDQKKSQYENLSPAP